MSHTLGQLATIVQGVVKGDENLIIEKLGTLENATASELSFLANAKYQGYLTSTQAGAVLVKTEDLAQLVDNAIIVSNPYLAFAQLSHLFIPKTQSWSSIHESAVIAANTRIAPNACIGPNVVIDEDCDIAEDCVIGAGCVIGRGTIIGRGTRLYPNVTLYHDVIVGEDCILHSGAVIGADGFGFAPNQGHWEKIIQLGSVVIGNNVEVGANTTIERGALENTLLGHGVIIDNQVQIAHNVEIGKNTVIASQTGIAGSTSVGENCMIGGQVGIAGHLNLGNNLQIQAQSGISKSLKDGSVVQGTHAFAYSEYNKSYP